MPLLLLRIKPANELDLPALLLICKRVEPVQVGDRFSLRAHPGSLKSAGEKAVAPVGGVSFWQAAALGVAHHDETRQALVFGSQAVSHPTTDAGPPHASVAGV